MVLIALRTFPLRLNAVAATLPAEILPVAVNEVNAADVAPIVVALIPVTDKFPPMTLPKTLSTPVE